MINTIKATMLGSESLYQNIRMKVLIDFGATRQVRKSSSNQISNKLKIHLEFFMHYNHIENHKSVNT